MTVPVRDPPVSEVDPSTAPLTLSVIVPAYRSTPVLPICMDALMSSDLDRSRWELIVVVDGDSMGRDEDRTAEIGVQYADAVIRLPGKPRGPSYARNRGAEVACGDVLVFIDSDVQVHPDTLSKIAHLFESRPEYDAAFGSYDARPAGRAPVSQYRNLLHHHVHHENAGEAETFWAGCGAVRRGVFHKIGMYDEWHFSRPQIEDIELGRRLRRRGHRIFLDPTIQVCHLKQWRLKEVLSTDLKNRGVPWTRLILHEGPSRGGTTLNVKPRHRLCVVLAFVSLLALLAAVALREIWPAWISLACIAATVALNFDLYRTLWREGGVVTALIALPLQWLFHLSNGLSVVSGWLAYFMVGAPQPPPDVAAFEELGIETWPPVPSRPKESVWYEHGG